MARGSWLVQVFLFVHRVFHLGNDRADLTVDGFFKQLWLLVEPELGRRRVAARRRSQLQQNSSKFKQLRLRSGSVHAFCS